MQPLEDFEFDSYHFSQSAIHLTNHEIPEKEKLQGHNKRCLETIANFQGCWEQANQMEKSEASNEDPFLLVENDLKRTKEFAIKNIVRESPND